MAESLLTIIIQMISLLFTNTASTFVGIIRLFGQLLESAGLTSEVGGFLGFAVSVLVVGVVGYFIAKILFRSGKLMIILFIIGLVLVYLLLLGLLV
jgi:hypothetical protein